MSNIIVWRKHPFVLLLRMITPLGQMILSAVGFVAIRLLFPQWYTAEPTLLPEILVATCGAWTMWHLVRRLRRAPAVAATPVTQRKALLDRIVFPLRLIIAVTIIILIVILILLQLYTSLEKRVFSPWTLIAFYYAFLVGWLVLEGWDWWNDQYILTDDSIIDLVRIPILFEQRVEAPLAMVQNATATTSFLGGIFQYGNVEVETAGGARSIIFENVWYPNRVQQAIFDRIDQLRERQQLQQREEQADQILRWFEAYDDLITRITLRKYPIGVQAGRPAHIVWQVSGPPKYEYVTNVLYDIESHANDDAYAFQTDPLPGKGSGIHRHNLLPPSSGRIYFKVHVVNKEDAEVYSSHEAMFTVGP